MAKPTGAVNDPFNLSLAWTAIAALGLIALGLVFNWVGDDGTLLDSTGGALFSLGLVTFISDFYLRRAYTYDLIRLVELSGHVKDVGFRRAETDRHIGWAQIFAGGTAYRFYLPVPTAWLSREWPSVLDAAQKRDVAVSVYLPDPAGPLLASQAGLVGQDAERFAASLEGVAETIEADWKNAAAANLLRPGSHVTIYLVTDLMPCGLVSVDAKHALLAHEVAVRTTQGPIVFQFEKEDESVPLPWFSRQWENISKKTYDKKYESSTPTLDLARSRTPIEEPT
ncbi:hypothetical protein [Modestobacter italicus]|nr:hypothetical protein [Modestobacter marinus]